MIGNISSIRRQVKNVAYNFSDAQVKVREATSNDPWGPSSSIMSEIADMTYNTMAFPEIMQMIWKRLNDHGKNWRHVYKSLVLLDYLIKVGSEKVAQQCRENIYSIQTLRDFQHIEENKDQGMNVREKAKQLVNLLKDDERLKNERARSLMARKRFAQNGMGIGSDGSTNSFRRSDTYYGDDDNEGAGMSSMDGVSVRPRRKSELEECRPASPGEEELQLQIALALSKEEAQKEDELRKHDELRLQMAISESRTVEKRHSLGSSPMPSPGGAFAAGGGVNGQSKKSAIDDLLSLQPAFGGLNSNDPFATPRGVLNKTSSLDPWGAPLSTHQSPAMALASSGVTNDPWAVGGVGGQPSAAGNTGFLLDSQLSPSGASGTTTLHHQDILLTMNSGVGGQAADPWGMDTLRSTLTEGQSSTDPFDLTLTSDQIGKSRATTKTPEHFLGENSALVNLDNLMGPAAKPVPGMPPRTAVNNPFGGTSAFGSQTAVNPFTAQARPSPTINEIRQTGTAANTLQYQAGGGGAWPQQPQPPASTTNPFL